MENVEGFYVGEKSKDHSSPEPYKGYRYVDYKEKESGKYYRNSWLDNNTSELCVPVCKFHSKFPAVSQTCFHFFNSESGCKIVA